MLYFLFLIGCMRRKKLLVTNMGTVGRYRSIDVKMIISLGKCFPEEICHDPNVHVHFPEMTCWYRCYISYPNWMNEKHFRKIQIKALWGSKGATMPTQVFRWDCVSREKYAMILLFIAMKWNRLWTIPCFSLIVKSKHFNYRTGGQAVPDYQSKFENEVRKNQGYIPGKNYTIYLILLQCLHTFNHCR